MIRKLQNIHPGEVLYEEFLLPLNISQNKIAREVGVPPRRINEIIHGKRSITADTSLRLAKYFGVNKNYFLGLQKDFDLEECERKIAKQISLIKPIK